ncbi:hypothetical protein [Mycoplasmopsis agassizii]|uniref:Uncharacterized protein n=1 Tax=Mycoplasmopsis agassizii TaxID=33922 RepID=A0ABX4H4A1_9BACT|nr:hypothetical protein [Mycoplasmopsis agassizii]PAF54710.1 hypothetical protein CJF60_03145 [Mycoplasmopsis agassizii]SMC15966.1 hypothetical protein SAMN02745179_00173 [Mycoplasmopsis agassizii]
MNNSDLVNQNNWPSNVFYFKLSDTYHLVNFANMKFTKLIYVPVIGTFLIFHLFKKMVLTNLADRWVRYNIGFRFNVSVGALMGLAIPISGVTATFLFIFALLKKEDPYLIDTKLLITFSPFLANLIITPINNYIVIKNLDKILCIDKNLVFEPDFIPYYNSKINNNFNWLKNLEKVSNKRTGKYFFSEGLESINQKEITTNYFNSELIDRIEHYTIYLGRFGGIPIKTVYYTRNQNYEKYYKRNLLFSWLFNYFTFIGLITQKAINDKMTLLSKRLTKIIIWNWVLDILFTVSLLVFLCSIFSSYSYLSSLENPDNAKQIVFVSSGARYELVDVILHFVYAFIFTFGYTIVSLIRNSYVKKYAIRIAQKAYLRNNPQNIIK